MPNVMAALPNIGGTPTTGVPCSNAAKTRNPLKLAGEPQTPEPVSAASGPKFTILWGHVQEILLFNKFFFRLSTLNDAAQMVIFSIIFAPSIFSEPRAALFRHAF